MNEIKCVLLHIRAIGKPIEKLYSFFIIPGFVDIFVSKLYRIDELIIF